MNKQLGRLQKVELRDIWDTEDKDFTPWLAKEENISFLGVMYKASNVSRAVSYTVDR